MVRRALEKHSDEPRKLAAVRAPCGARWGSRMARPKKYRGKSHTYVVEWLDRVRQTDVKWVNVWRTWSEHTTPQAAGKELDRQIACPAPAWVRAASYTGRRRHWRVVTVTRDEAYRRRAW